MTTPGEFARVAAERVARVLRRAGETGATVSLALAGGSTPRPVYRELSQRPGLPWERVEAFFGDERAVPPDHPDSNYRMAREALLERVPVPPERVHRMEAERDDRDAAAREYGALLPERLDLLLLGIGSDGHTASLFPDSTALGEEERRVVPSEAPDEPRARLTVTPPVIRMARAAIVLARGEAKAGAVTAALEGPPDPGPCPARLARDRTWILDEEAASGLDRRSGDGDPTSEPPADTPAGGGGRG